MSRFLQQIRVLLSSGLALKNIVWECWRAWSLFDKPLILKRWEPGMKLEAFRTEEFSDVGEIKRSAG